jgi:hypothetical protein
MSAERGILCKQRTERIPQVADVNWIDSPDMLPDDWDELSDTEKAAWTRGFMAGGARALEKVMTSMATSSSSDPAFDAEEARQFLNAVPKEALPDA